MNKKTRKHNMKVYRESVERAKANGGIYIVSMSDGSPLPKSTQYLMDVSREKMKRKESRK